MIFIKQQLALSLILITLGSILIGRSYFLTQQKETLQAQVNTLKLELKDASHVTKNLPLAPAFQLALGKYCKAGSPDAIYFEANKRYKYLGSPPAEERGAYFIKKNYILLNGNMNTHSFKFTISKWDTTRNIIQFIHGTNLFSRENCNGQKI